MAINLQRLREMLFGKRGDVATPEYAWGGSKIFGGIVLDEFNPDLRGQRAAQTAGKMRRTDAQVRAVQQILGLPIRATVWYVDGPDSASAAEKEAAELLRENLFGGMEQSFDDLLREATLAIYLGYRAPEVVWGDDAGRASIRKVASRNPELIERWLYDETGNLVGYLYTGNRPLGNGLTEVAPAATRFERIPIPLQKTIHFVYDQENESPEGFGLWRSMYPHWYHKQALYKIMGIGVERNLLGVPIGRLHQGAQADDKQALLRILSRLRAAEDAAFVLPYGDEVEWFESKRTLMDALPLVQHHDSLIARAALAQFLNLGQTSTGTQALAEEHVKVFELAEEANARWVEQTINRQLVRTWCLLNYGEGLRAPELKHRTVQSLDLKALAETLNLLTSGGYLAPLADDEDRLRDLMDLPAVPDDQKKARQQQQQQRSGNGSGANGEPRQAREVIHDGRCFAEDETEKERKRRDRREGDFQEQATAQLQAMEIGYLEKLRPVVEEIERVDPIAQGQPVARLADVEVPGAQRYEEFVRRFLWQVFHEGRESLQRDTGQDAGAKPIPNRTRQWISARAAVIAADHLAQLRTAVLERVLSGIRAEMPASQIFSDAGAEAIERLNCRMQEDWNAAAAEVVARVNEEIA